MSIRSSRLSRSTGANVVGGLLVFASLIAATVRVFRPTNLHADFAYIFVAGRTWRAGLNPYGDAFGQVARALFSGHGEWTTGWVGPPESWVYPFQWSSLATPLALLPFPMAALTWQFVIALSILCSIWLLCRCSDELPSPPPLFLKGLFAFVVVTSEAAHWNSWLGQTGSILFLGLSCAIYGFTFRRSLVLATGLTILLLKPQYGLAILLIALLEKEHWKSALMAVFATIVMSLPGFLLIGVGQAPDAVHGFQYNLANYVRHPANTPLSLTGIGHILWYVGIVLPPTVYTLMGAIVSVALICIGRANGYNKGLVYWCAALTAMCIVPLHGHDLLPLFSILLLLPLMDAAGLFFALLGAALMYRPYDSFGWKGLGGMAEVVIPASLFLLVAMWRLSPPVSLLPRKSLATAYNRMSEIDNRTLD